MDFIFVIEHNVGRVNIPANIGQLIAPMLPRDFYFFLDVGGMVPSVLHRRSSNIHTNTSLICQAYGVVERLEASITYTLEGWFNVVRIMPQVDDASSDYSTDSDYRAFLAGYSGNDFGSHAGMDVGMDADLEEAESDAGLDIGSDGGFDSVVTHL